MKARRQRCAQPSSHGRHAAQAAATSPGTVPPPATAAQPMPGMGHSHRKLPGAVPPRLAVNAWQYAPSALTTPAAHSKDCIEVLNEHNGQSCKLENKTQYYKSRVVNDEDFQAILKCVIFILSCRYCKLSTNRTTFPNIPCVSWNHAHIALKAEAAEWHSIFKF